MAVTLGGDRETINQVLDRLTTSDALREAFDHISTNHRREQHAEVAMACIRFVQAFHRLDELRAQAHPPTLQAPHCPTCTCHQGEAS